MTKQEITELKKLVWFHPIEEILGHIITELDTKVHSAGESLYRLQMVKKDIDIMVLDSLNTLTLAIEGVKLMNEDKTSL